MVIPEFGQLKPKIGKFEAILGYMVIPYFKNNRNQTENKTTLFLGEGASSQTKERQWGCLQPPVLYRKPFLHQLQNFITKGGMFILQTGVLWEGSQGCKGPWSVSDIPWTLPCPSLAGCYLSYSSNSSVEIQSWLIPSPQMEEKRKVTEEILQLSPGLGPWFIVSPGKGMQICKH